MPLVPLTLTSIGQLANGEAELVINKALARAVHDLDDRGEDGQSRKVIITLDLVRRSNGEVDVNLAVNCKAPAMVTHSTTCLLRQTASGEADLRFQTRNADNPNQSTLDFEPGESGR